MTTLSPPPVDEEHRLGVVLAGGAARGAYEVGVLQYIDQEIGRALGTPIVLDVLCGTSVGAINACALASRARAPIGGRTAPLQAAWEQLSIGDMVRFDGRELVHLFRRFRAKAALSLDHLSGGLMDASPLAELLLKAIPFTHIDSHLRSGHLTAISVSTTEVASGATTVFVQRAKDKGPLPWNPADPHVRAKAVRLRASHALASAALPVLFPAVRIDGRYYSDGGLRQNVPISPARRLGADSLIVVNPRFEEPLPAPQPLAEQREKDYPGPLFLLGKSLNALVLDRVDNDIDRLERINDIIAAGTRAFGDTFVERLNGELASVGERPVRPLKVVHIRPSQNLAEIGADYVRSTDFDHVGGFVGRLLRQLAGDASKEADLLSYLLFDGEYAKRLMEVGRADARAQHDALCELIEPRIRLATAASP